MNRLTRPALTLALASCVVSLTASAHDLWIEPSSFHPAVGETVTATLRVGQKLQGETLPRNPVLVDRFLLKGPSAETPAAGVAGADPAGSARVTEPGLQWLAYQSHPFPVVVDAPKFEDYLVDEGLERIAAERARNGQTGEQGIERFYRCAKALLSVPGAPAAGAPDVPLGLTLELVPGKSPYALKTGGELPLTLRFRGEPIAGILVIAMSKADPEKRVSARTDAKGQVRLKIAHPGFWLVKAVHMQAAPKGAGVDWESWWASLTFDLPATPRK